MKWLEKLVNHRFGGYAILALVAVAVVAIGWFFNKPGSNLQHATMVELERDCQEFHAIAIRVSPEMHLKNATQVPDEGDFAIIGPECIGADFPEEGTILTTKTVNSGFITGEARWTSQYRIGEVTKEEPRKVSTSKDHDVEWDLDSGQITVVDREEAES